MQATFKLGAELMRNDDGAQVVEYALLIALVSIALTLLLASGNGTLQQGFTALVTRISNCFTPGASTC